MTQKGGTPYIHTACEKGYVNLVRALVQRHGTGILKDDVTARDDEGNTPLHVAAISGKRETVLALVNEFGCNISIKGYKGRSLLHSLCVGGDTSLIRTFICGHKADITARDDEGNTPLHVAALSGSEDVVKVLINEFGCNVNETGHLGRSLLHSACASEKGLPLLRFVTQHISPWVVDDNGDTPLHICARSGYIYRVRDLLELNPPVMIRNNLGQTPKDLEDKQKTKHGYTGDIDAYIKKNKHKIYSQYEIIQRQAKKKYSLPEPITRAFVIGYSGAGKSSLVEALKREGLLDSFKRVSESSVPPHTAGIVPSIHTSKHYGRVLFYDFAGDAEYYSSHAAILENLASSRKGNNILFLLVIDMREEMAEIKKTFHYWFSFIQHQQFHGQKPRLIVVGSHLDLLAKDVAKARGEEFQMFCDSIDTKAVQMSALFMLDCCKPRSKQIAEIQTLMSKTDCRFSSLQTFSTSQHSSWVVRKRFQQCCCLFYQNFAKPHKGHWH